MQRCVLAAGIVGVALALAGRGGSSDRLQAAVAVAKSSSSQTFEARLTLTGVHAFGVTPAPLQGKGAFLSNGIVYERVDLPGPLDKNKTPPRDYLVVLPAK